MSRWSATPGSPLKRWRADRKDALAVDARQLACLAAARLLAPGPDRRGARRLDVPGAALATAGLAALA